MVCVCGHKKSEHLSGIDYGRNGWMCNHEERNTKGYLVTCQTSCSQYTKKTKEADGQ